MCNITEFADSRSPAEGCPSLLSQCSVHIQVIAASHITRPAVACPSLMSQCCQTSHNIQSHCAHSSHIFRSCCGLSQPIVNIPCAHITRWQGDRTDRHPMACKHGMSCYVNIPHYKMALIRETMSQYWQRLLVTSAILYYTGSRKICHPAVNDQCLFQILWYIPVNIFLTYPL